MRRIVLLGGEGQLGWELQRALSPLGELFALDRTGMVTKAPTDTPAPLCGDLGQPEALCATLQALRPDIVVNAAAYTAVDRAEAEPAAAAAINAVAPGELARLCARRGAWLVHYSTDYVFDGSGDRPWREDDAARPLSTYGRTKLAGEEGIRASGCRHLILRTSWLHSPRGNNFPRTILRLANEREELQVVNDQIGAPTGADLVADLTAHALRDIERHPELSGTYHAAAAGETSRFDYARFIVEQARRCGLPVRPTVSIAAVPSSETSTSARRPKNSRLDCGKLEAAFGLRMPAWQDGVRRLVAELAG